MSTGRQLLIFFSDDKCLSFPSSSRELVEGDTKEKRNVSMTIRKLALRP